MTPQQVDISDWKESDNSNQGFRLMKFDNLDALKNLENGGSISVALLSGQEPNAQFRTLQVNELS